MCSGKPKFGSPTQVPICSPGTIANSPACCLCLCSPVLATGPEVHQALLYQKLQRAPSKSTPNATQHLASSQLKPPIPTMLFPVTHRF